MAIEKIRFGQVDVNNANLLAMRPSNIDTTSAFPDLGAKILAAFEPTLKANAEKEGLVAGSAVPIIKNEDGTYNVPEVPEAGTVYQEAFTNAMTLGYKNKVFFDYSNTVDQFMAENPRDPQAFLAKAQGAAEGILKTIPPEIAAEISPDLNREISQRFGGITRAKVSEDRSVLLQDLNAQETSFLQRASQLFRIGTPESKAEGEIFVARARETMLRTRELTNATDPSGIVAFETSVDLQRDIASGMALEDAQRKADAARSRQMAEIQFAETLRRTEERDKTMELVGLLEPKVRELPDADLDLFKRMVDGNVAPDERLVVGEFSFNRQEFLTAFPDTAAVNSTLGGTVNAEIRSRDGDRVAKREAERQQKITNEIRDAAAYGTGVNSVEAKASLDEAAYNFDMSTNEGRSRASEFIAQTGYVPKNVVTYLDRAARTTNLNPEEAGGILFDAANFYSDLKQLSRRDPSRPGEVLNQGAAVISQLDKRTRDLLHFVSETRTLRGTGPSVIAEAVRIVASGADALTPQQVQSRIPNYNKQADALIREAFNIDEEASVPAYLRQEFDNNYNLLAQGFSAEDAISMATVSIKDEHEPNPAFYNGIGNKSFAFDMNPIALNKYMKTNFPSIDINFAAELGKAVRVMKSPSSTVGDPSYTFSYLDRAGNTTHRTTIAKSQLPEVRMKDFTAQERLDAELANIQIEHIKSLSSLGMGMGTPPPQEAYDMINARRDAAIKRASDRYAVEIGAAVPVNTPINPNPITPKTMGAR